MNRRKFLTTAGFGAAGFAAGMAVPTEVTESVIDKIKGWVSYPWHHTTTLSKKKAGVAGYRTYLIGSDAIIDNPPGWVSYSYHMQASVRPDAAQRIRFIDLPKDGE